MAFAPSASWNSRSITHLANYPSPSSPMISSDEPLNWGDRPREDWCVAKHRNVAPFYKFNFDLSPPIDGRKWRLFLKISFRNSEDRDQPRDATDKGQRIELGAVETVIDLALGGRLGTIKQCRIPDCCKWYTTKDDPRVLCCPDHSSDDLRKGTPERKEQLRTAAKKTRGDEKERQAQGWKDVGKKGDHKGPSRRAQKS